MNQYKEENISLVMHLSICKDDVLYKVDVDNKQSKHVQVK